MEASRSTFMVEQNDWPGWYGVAVNGTQIVDSYERLHEILGTLSTFKRSKVVGPAMGSSVVALYKELVVTLPLKLD